MFKIGDLVAFRTALAESVYGRVPLAYMVTGVLTQASAHDSHSQVLKTLHGGDGERQALEVELIRWDAPEVTEAIAAATKFVVTNRIFPNRYR